MSKSGTKQIIRVLLVLGGLILGVVSFFVIRPKFTEKTVKLTNESVVLLSQINQLNTLLENEEKFTKIKDYCESESRRILDKYPANVLEEDAILYAGKLIGQRDMKISLVEIAPEEMLLSFNEMEEELGASGTVADTIAPSTELGIQGINEVLCPDYRLHRVLASYDFTIGYEDLKSVISRIQSDSDKRNIPVMTLTYDSTTGILIGNINVNMFYMTGTDKIYYEPDAGVVVKGTDNIFGTFEPETEEAEGTNKNNKNNKKNNDQE